MAAYTDVRSLIAHRFNSEYGTDLKFEQLVIDSIQSNDIPDMLQYNTIITVSGANKDPLSVFYNRFDIKTYVSMPKIELQLPSNADGTLAQLLPYVNDLLGLDLTADEIVPGNYSVEKTEFTIRFTIADSINFIRDSYFDITVAAGYRLHKGNLHCPPVDFKSPRGFYKPDIYQAPNELSGYSRYGTDRSMPALVSAHIDYTPVAHILRNICAPESYSTNSDGHVRITNGNMAQLMSALRSVDGNQYTVSSRDITLYFTWVVYNGPTKEARGYSTRLYSYDHIPVYIEPKEMLAAYDMVDESYDNVLIMTTLDGNSNYTMKVAHLLFHYNGGL